MRVIETIHPNPQMRTFTVDQVLSNVRISNFSSFIVGEKPTEKASKLYSQLDDIPLLNDVSLDKYSISLTIEEAFENSEEDWKSIRTSVFYYLASFFEVKIPVIENSHFVKDDRKKYETPPTAVNFDALYKTISNLKIPHDFETHRAAWRTAIADKVSSYSELDDPEGRYVYWKNELEKFDLAFDALLALRLPQS